MARISCNCRFWTPWWHPKLIIQTYAFVSRSLFSIHICMMIRWMGLKWLLFTPNPLLPRCETQDHYKMASNFTFLIWTSYSLSKWKFMCLLFSPHAPPTPSITFFFFGGGGDRRPTSQRQSTWGSWPLGKFSVRKRGDFTAGNWTANLFLEIWVSLHHHPLV